MENLPSFVKKSVPSVIGLYKTHLQPVDADTLCKLGGFKLFRQDRCFESGGGLALFISGSFPVKALPAFSRNATDFESLAVEVRFSRSLKIIVGLPR